MTKYQYVTTELRIQTTGERPDVFDLRDIFREKGMFTSSQEVFWVVSYDSVTQLHLIAEIARGDQYKVDVSIPAMMNAVILSGTNRFQIVHNHPSGKVQPTRQDLRLTKQIMVASAICGLILEDHAVIGPPEAWWSMVDHKQMKPSPEIDRIVAASAHGPVWTHKEPA